MRRQEFIDEVTTWDELLSAADELREYDLLSDIYSDEARNDWINESLMDWARELDWQDMLGRLSDFNSDSSEWWQLDDYGEWNAVSDGDDYFEDMKSELLEIGDDNSAWDDAEEGEEDTEDEELFDPEPDLEIDEDQSVGDFFVECNSVFKTIEEKIREDRTNEERSFKDFIPF